MNYLLDTCILSKARKSHSDSEKLRLWINQYPETNFYISVVSIGEIQMGISKLGREQHERKKIFENWLMNELIPRFERRILEIDHHICLLWGKLCGEAQKKGKPLPAMDALLAASAIYHQLILVTENTKDFLATGVKFLNPLEKSFS